MTREFEAPDLIEVMEEAVRYNRFLIEQIADGCGDAATVLDFGAGNGRFASGMLDRGWQVHAVEPDPGLRERLRSRGIVASESLEALETRSFEAIYSVNVLEHIDDDRAVLASLHDLLRPGGRLFLYVPAFEVLFSANDARVGHRRRYRLGPLVGAVEAVGFQVRHARYVDSAGFFAGLWYRWFGDPEGGLNPAAVRLYDRAVFPISRLLDRVFDRFVGKNLLIRAVRPARG